jgi:hypothetical protein
MRNLGHQSLGYVCCLRACTIDDAKHSASRRWDCPCQKCKYAILPKGKYVKLQSHTTNFLDIWNRKAMLVTNKIFLCLDTSIRIPEFLVRSIIILITFYETLQLGENSEKLLLLNHGRQHHDRLQQQTVSDIVTLRRTVKWTLALPLIIKNLRSHNNLLLCKQGTCLRFVLASWKT